MTNMCANCEHRGKTFQSAYSGKTMVVCKLTEKSQFDYQGCDDWEHYKKVERCSHVIGFAGNPRWTCLKTMKRCKDPYDTSCTEYEAPEKGGKQK